MVRLLATLAVAGFLGVALVRFAPGYGTSESELNGRLSQDSIHALRTARDANLFRIYGQFLRRAWHGDLGSSEALGGLPVADLLRDRLPVTLLSAGTGLLAAWVVMLVLAGLGAGLRRKPLLWFGSIVTESLLALPTGLLALLLFGVWESGVVVAGIGLAVFPHLFRYGSRLIAEAAGRPHVLAAYARGLSPWRVLVREILPSTMAELAALAGTSVPLAIGAAIPIETICDSPGVGQLAWRAATARDLDLLLPIILLVSAVALTANFAADLAIAGRKVAA